MGNKLSEIFSKVGLINDDAIGIVSITNVTQHGNTYNQLFFDKNCNSKINCDYISFDKKNLTVKIRPIENKGAYKLSQSKHGGHITVPPPVQDITGYYEMVDEGEYFKLYKIEK
jgi:hypothetical protein